MWQLFSFLFLNTLESAHNVYFLLVDGPYSVFAGRDASRGLAMFSVSEDVIREEYDDLSDLNSEQMERVREWEQQLSGKSVRELDCFIYILSKGIGSLVYGNIPSSFCLDSGCLLIMP